mmetsp:Transcript_42487/g.92568  ORF Transcript_42487/g.92568 Transcript_42487/m.92568 type:complete len:134 (-) Transcript_42487:129-530(-)
MVQRTRSGAVLLVLAAVVAFFTAQDAFVGARPSQGASRVAMQARGGVTEVMEILVTHQPTGMRTRFSIPPDTTIAAVKTQAIKELGVDWDWMTEKMWVVSKEGKGKADALEESKTAKDCGINKGDELLVWFTP